jgi:hypothetical protein
MRAIVCAPFFASAACALAACSLPAFRGHGPKPPAVANHQLAVATFEEARLPIAPNSRGVMVGYIPAPDGGAADDPHDAQFTYLIDFLVVSSRNHGEQVEGRGVRHVFFNPGGAHASFADPLSFSHGRQIETDTVRLFGDYTSEDVSVTLQMRVYESSFEQVEFEGRPVAAPANEPSIFRGVWRDNIGGWMLTGAPASF